MNTRDMADRLGVSQATVSRLRSGKRRPSLDMMYKIEDVMRWNVAMQAKCMRAGDFPREFAERMERLSGS